MIFVKLEITLRSAQRFARGKLISKVPPAPKMIFKLNKPAVMSFITITGMFAGRSGRYEFEIILSIKSPAGFQLIIGKSSTFDLPWKHCLYR